MFDRYVGLGINAPPDSWLKISGNGRYFLKDDVPFLLIGDSPQGIMPCLTPTQMETYMTNREGYGINTLQVHLLAGTTFGGNSTTFQAQDGTHAFTVDGDISTPNEAYFSQVDTMINLAASHGMFVMPTTAEFIDNNTLFANNGITKCTAFGQYLGNRYRNFPNIIWDIGNDMDVADGDSNNPPFYAVFDGIATMDSRHLRTVLLGGVPPTGSRTDSDWDSRCQIDQTYSYYPTYGIMLTEYALSPAKPVFFGEGNYEGESNNGYLTTPYIIRKQMYWAMLSGGCGHIYCNTDIWHFLSGWATRLDSYPGLTHVTYLTALLTAYSWWSMIPDNAHNILTAGYGTYDDSHNTINTNDYATCAYIPGVSLAMIYMPDNRTMTVDMSQFSGTVTCRWFDPTNGSYTADAASPHANSGTHDFSRVSTNVAGDADWVLVLSV